MPNNKKFLIGCLIFPFLVVFAFLIGYFTIAKRMPSASVTPADSWLIVNPSGFITDYSEIRHTPFMNLGSDSVEDICRKLKAAAKDSKIKGVILRPRFVQISYAGISELETALKAFKQSGKPVYAFGDMINQKDYLICSLADSIHMEPSASAGISLEGVNAGITFYKEMFDKLGIKMHVLQTGDFKSFGEPYTQTSLSAGTLENYRRVLGARYNLIKEQIAKRRSLSPEQIRIVFEEREDYFVSPTQAMQYGLIDRLVNRDAFYQKHNISTHQMLEIADYTEQSINIAQKDKIAVVYLNGSISPQTDGSFGYDSNISAAKVQGIIDDIKKDANIRAVVLRINSGGGSALESELIYQKLMQLKASLPIVISMGGVAASGAYYISCASNYIVADEYCITGSIGVVMLIPEAEGLSRKVGLRNQNISFGKFAGSYDLLSKTDPAFLNSLKRNSDAVYAEFKSRILNTRPLDATELEMVAKGKIWSAADAKEHALIDAIGSLDLAIMKAAELSKLKTFDTITLPGKLSWIEAIRSSNAFRLANGFLHWDGKYDASQLEHQLKNQFQTNEWLFITPMEIN